MSAAAEPRLPRKGEAWLVWWGNPDARHQDRIYLIVRVQRDAGPLAQQVQVTYVTRGLPGVIYLAKAFGIDRFIAQVATP